MLTSDHIRIQILCFDISDPFNVKLASKVNVDEQLLLILVFRSSWAVICTKTQVLRCKARVS